MDKRTVIENYDLVSLAIDEIVDDGIILETDPVIIATRVSRPPAQDVSTKGIDLSEQGLISALDYFKTKGMRISSIHFLIALTTIRSTILIGRRAHNSGALVRTG